MTYSAVVTTGIYCRPGCSARPLPEHVRPFELAAAAEAAGYRACLRCRPYRTAPTTSLEAPELVCRAVRLITDGVLDDGGEADLASRLGVSARHLRRLFVEHVGATPDQLARSRRAHFARRLLDDTDLTITEIAFASGFGSLRQMNRTFVEIFRARPTDLRRRRRASDRLVADGGLLLRTPTPPGYDWAATVAQLHDRAIPGVESVAGTTYRRTIVVDGDPAVVEVDAGDDDNLLVRLHLPHWEGLIHVVQRVRRLVGLDTDEAPGAWDAFEAEVRARVADPSLLAALVEAHGVRVPGLADLGLRSLFPAPEALADTGVADARLGV